MTRLTSQLFDCLSEKGMDPIRGNLGGRFERKTPLMQPRVGELQDGTTAHSRCREEEVEVECPGPPGFFPRPVAAGNRLELAAAIEQRPWSSRPVEQGRSVEKIGLGRADWTGAPQSRHRRHSTHPGQGLERLRKGCPGLAEIAAETENHPHHGHKYR